MFLLLAGSFLFVEKRYNGRDLSLRGRKIKFSKREDVWNSRLVLLGSAMMIGISGQLSELVSHLYMPVQKLAVICIIGFKVAVFDRLWQSIWEGLVQEVLFASQRGCVSCQRIDN